jgi:hypothetical protein
LYYPGNTFIDASNTWQVFEARIRRSAVAAVEWSVNDVVQVQQPSDPAHFFLYKLAGSGGDGEKDIVRARLPAHPGVVSEALVVKLNYTWPS